MRSPQQQPQIQPETKCCRWSSVLGRGYIKRGERLFFFESCNLIAQTLCHFFCEIEREFGIAEFGTKVFGMVIMLRLSGARRAFLVFVFSC